MQSSRDFEPELVRENLNLDVMGLDENDIQSKEADNTLTTAGFGVYCLGLYRLYLSNWNFQTGAEVT